MIQTVVKILQQLFFLSQCLYDLIPGRNTIRCTLFLHAERRSFACNHQCLLYAAASDSGTEIKPGERIAGTGRIHGCNVKGILMQKVSFLICESSLRPAGKDDFHLRISFCQSMKKSFIAVPCTRSQCGSFHLIQQQDITCRHRTFQQRFIDR